MVRYHEIVKDKYPTVQNILTEYFIFGSDHHNFDGKPWEKKISYEIKENNSVDVFGNVKPKKTMDKLPIKFNEVHGFFDVTDAGLSTLEGCPVYCKGFYCSLNNITSLEFGPKKVLGDYICIGNKGLTSLDGLAAIIDGELTLNNCSNLKIDWDTKIQSNIAGDIFIPYRPDLPLLRYIAGQQSNPNMQVTIIDLDNVPGLREMVDEYQWAYADELNSLKRKKIIYDCQYALIKAGHKGNAKW